MGKYFVNKSRNIRKKLRQDLKNRVSKAYHDKGRLFDTDHYVNPEASWIDICFLGVDKATIYSCALTNARLSLSDKASEIADNESEEIIPFNDDLEGYDIVKDYSICGGLSEIKTRKHAYKELNNLTRYEWCKQRENELIKDIYTNEYVKLDYSYTYAIGMEAVIDTVLDTNNINRFIVDFISRGEKQYCKNEKLFLDDVYIPSDYPEFKTDGESTKYHEINDTVSSENIPKHILQKLGIK